MAVAARYGSIPRSRSRTIEEEESLAALQPGEPRILALGGGAVLSEAVRRALAAPDVFVVFLEAPASCLVERLRSSARRRPSLLGLPLEKEVSELLRQRRALYEKVADFRLETFSANVDACCASILDFLDKMHEVP